jgi:hypothetical protein
VDLIESRRTRLRPVQSGGVLAYSLRRHKGRRVRLADGTVISFGDLVLEVHLDNGAMTQAAGTSPWRRLELARADLAVLGQAVADARFGPVRAAHGTALLGVAGRRIGFELYRLPRTWKWRIERIFLVGMDVIHHPQGTRRLHRPGAERWPSELWMSRATLLDRYGPGSGSAPSALRM